MPRLITLGGLSLESEDGATSAVLSPRRLALLAVVAASGSGITRDALLAIFWPESDQERARNALNQALFVIRRELPAGALIDGRLDVRLGDVLSCDASDFKAAVDANDVEQAAALYRGPFLHGVHIRDSGEFERWRDATAAGLAQQYRDALEAIATRLQSEGDAVAALRWSTSARTPSSSTWQSSARTARGARSSTGPR